MRKTGWLAVAALLAFGGAAWAAGPPRTTITVKDLHCPSCARKVAARLATVPGVAEVRTDVNARTATVAPRPGQQPSPRALWDAVEQAGHEPVRLEGPAGAFTDRPPS